MALASWQNEHSVFCNTEENIKAAEKKRTPLPKYVSERAKKKAEKK